MTRTTTTLKARRVSYQQQLKAKRGSLGILLRAYARRMAADKMRRTYNHPDIIAAAAFDWWEDTVKAMRPVEDLGITEGYLADMLVEKLRHQPGWTELLKEALK